MSRIQIYKIYYRINFFYIKVYPIYCMNEKQEVLQKMSDTKADHLEV